MNPIKEQVDLLMKVFPNAKTVGVIYCSSEVNSEVQVKAMQEYEATSSEKIGLVVFEMSHDMVAQEELMASVNLSRKQIAAGLCMLLFDRIQNPTTTKRCIKLESLVEVF